MTNLGAYNVQELQSDELLTIDGGEPITAGAVAVAVGVGVAAVGVVLVGAAVGYGIYKLVDWATS